MKKEKNSVWISILILSIILITFFGISTKFDKLSILSTAFMAGVLGLFLFYSSKKGKELFYLVSITSISIYVALINSFGKIYSGDSPLTLNLVLGPWTLFIISIISTFIILKGYEKSRSKNKFGLILLILFVIVWVILSINVKYFDDWKLENYLTIPFILLLYGVHKWFRLSNLSYGLIYVYMIFHILGTHYTYSDVPFGFWISEILNLSRNHYDRIVHFAFGFLLAYPLREFFMRVGKSKGFWSFYIPIEFVLAFSAIYELIEWCIAIVFGGDLGIAYLGTQGDVWDAQKDMALAALGSLITMTIVAIVHLSFKGKKFWLEFKKSFSIKKEILGEEALKKLGKKQQNL